MYIMDLPGNIESLKEQIFNIQSEQEFIDLALEIFLYQAESNTIYKQYIRTLGIDVNKISNINEIPFLPISFFKTHKVICGEDESESQVFYSSTTTSEIPSKHYVKNLELYEKSFTKGFEYFYGNSRDYCILALLPSYLERVNSSLVYMVNSLISNGDNPESGFYMYNHKELIDKIKRNEERKQKTLLIGVTFALLDLAEKFSLPLEHTIIMETGGMKGKREELTRQEVHKVLSHAFHVNTIHSEFGMTELLSQAYSNGNGIFHTVPWMRLLIRDIYDPFRVGLINETGALNIIDLANINSCSFIATDDLGKAFNNSFFEVIGRLDNSDIRGCNLMTI